MSKEEIKRLLMNGNTKEYSHMIIFCDTFDYEDYAVYVKYDQDVEQVIKDKKKLGNMIKVMEVYNYNLDLETQLNEYRANHIEPKIKKDNNKINSEDKIKKALEFAKDIHENQTRKDDTPYINHPIRVAENVINFVKSDDLETLIIAAYLHDTIEDTKENKEVVYNKILNNFGNKVAAIVMELTSDKSLVKELGKTKYLQIKLKTISSDALNIKLCDRLDNVKDLIAADEAFRRKYINETLEIIDYLINNRKLTKEQLIIISNIYIVISKHIEKDSKLMIKML